MSDIIDTNEQNGSTDAVAASQVVSATAAENHVNGDSTSLTTEVVAYSEDYSKIDDNLNTIDSHVAEYQLSGSITAEAIEMATPAVVTAEAVEEDASSLPSPRMSSADLDSALLLNNRELTDAEKGLLEELEKAQQEYSQDESRESQAQELPLHTGDAATDEGLSAPASPEKVEVEHVARTSPTIISQEIATIEYLTSLDYFTSELDPPLQLEEHDSSLLEDMLRSSGGANTASDEFPIHSYYKSTLFIATEKAYAMALPNGHVSAAGTPFDDHMNAVMEPFAMQCLHLYNGNWTVLKPNDEMLRFRRRLPAELQPPPMTPPPTLSSPLSSPRGSYSVTTLIDSPRSGAQAHNEQLKLQPRKTGAVNPQQVLAYNNPSFVPSAHYRKLIHPHIITRDKQKHVFVKAHYLKLNAGYLEPLFCSLVLMNVRNGEFLSERFYFHLNSYTIINDFVDDFNYKRLLIKHQKEEPTPHAVFSLSDLEQTTTPSSAYYSGAPYPNNVLGSVASLATAGSSASITITSPRGNSSQAQAMADVTAAATAALADDDTVLPKDIFLVLIVEKTLQGYSIDSIIKTYSSGTPAQEQAHRTTIENQCTGLKQFRQPFFFAFSPLFENDENAVAESMRLELSRRSSMRASSSPQTSAGAQQSSFYRRNSMKAPTTRSSMTFKAIGDILGKNYQDAQVPYKLREGLITMSPLHCIDPDCDESIFDAIQKEGNRDGTLKKQKKVIEGYCLLEVSPFDPVAFENNTIMRRVLIGRGIDQQLSHADALEAVKRNTEYIKKEVKQEIFNATHSVAGGYHQVSEDERKVYLRYQQREFQYRVPRHPFFTFTHSLYVYPESVNLTKARHPLAGNKLKPRNILLEIVMKDSATSVQSRLVSKFSKELVHTLACGVTFQSKAPTFLDEICVMLPLPIKPSHHLVFNFYHLHIEKSVAKRRKDASEEQQVKRTLFGYSVLPLEYALEPYNKAHQLPIYHQLGNGYLMSTAGLTSYDQKRNTFRLRTRLESSIYPKEPALYRFFRDCAPFLNAVDPEKRYNPKFLSNAIEVALDAMKELTERVDFPKIVSHYPLVLDMVFSIICRAPDLLNSFISTKEHNAMANIAMMSSETSNLILGGTNDGSKEGRRLSTLQKRRSYINMAGGIPGLSPGSTGSFSMESQDTRSRSTSSATAPPPAGNRRFSMFKQSSDLSSSPAPSSSPSLASALAKPGDSNFNLLEYLKAQEKNQARASLETKKENSSSKRLSLFRKGGSRDSDADTFDQGLEALRKNLNGATGDDISDFFGVSQKLFELQRTSFRTLVYLITSASKLHRDPSRNNVLLSSYVNFVFKDIVLTASPLCFVLAEQWTEILTKSGESGDDLHNSMSLDPRGSRYLDTATKKRRSVVASLIPQQATLLDQEAALALWGNGADAFEAEMMLLSASPIHHYSLVYCWFFFDILVKSFMLTKPVKDGTEEESEDESPQTPYTPNLAYRMLNDGGLRFYNVLRELVGAIADKLRDLKENNFTLAFAINQYAAYFFRDLLATHMKTSYVFLLIDTYLTQLTNKDGATGASSATTKLLVDFMHNMSDDPQFVSLNNSTHMEDAMKDRSIFAPPVRLLVSVIYHCIRLQQREPEMLNKATELVRYVLTRCDLDERLQVSAKQRNFLARLYFPYVELMGRHAEDFLQVIPVQHRKDHCLCIGWVLFNLDRHYLIQRIRKDSVLRFNIIKLIALAVDVAGSAYVSQGDSPSTPAAPPGTPLRPYNPTQSQEIVADPVIANEALLKGLQGIYALIFGDQEVYKALRDEIDVGQGALEPQSTDISLVIPYGEDSLQSSSDSNAAQYGSSSESYSSKQSKQSLVQLCVYTTAQMLLKLNEQNLPFESSFVQTVANLIDSILHTMFRDNLSSTYFKWIYASLMNGMQLPQVYNPSRNVKHIDLLLEKMENCITSNPYVTEKENSCSVDNIAPFYVDADEKADVELDADNPGYIKAATLERLVERLTAQNQTDQKLQEIFFLTYRSFCSSVELMRTIMARFMYITGASEGGSPSTSPSPSSIANAAAAKVFALRIVNALRHWLNEHFYDFDYNPLVVTLVRFLDKKLSSSEHVSAKVANQLKKRLEQNLFGIESSLTSTTTSSSTSGFEKPLLPKKAQNADSIDLLAWHPMELARQLTLIDWNLFRHVRPKEMLRLAWTKKNKEQAAPNIVALSYRFNELSQWIASMIVQYNDVKLRALLVKHWITVADSCRELNNLNGLNCIISALNNAGVHRLKKTWEMVALLSKKDNALTAFKNLCDLMSSSGSYRNAREFISTYTIGRACVPYIGLYLTDLVFIEDGNKDTRAVQGRDCINFQKRRYVAGIIMELRRYQQSGLYSFGVVPMLRDYFLSALKQDVLSEKEIYQKSLEVEPRSAS